MLAVMPSMPAEAPRASLAALSSMLQRPWLTLLIDPLVRLGIHLDDEFELVISHATMCNAACGRILVTLSLLRPARDRTALEAWCQLLHGRSSTLGTIQDEFLIELFLWLGGPDGLMIGANQSRIEL